MTVPFQSRQLDDLMAAENVDVVVVNSKFNIQYLLGGYRFFFFANMDATGLSRYLPLLAYRQGSTEESFYVGAGNEDWGTEIWDMWMGEVRNEAWTSVRAAEIAAEMLRQRGLSQATIAVELSFIPADAMEVLRHELPDARFVNAQRILEELRAVKTPEELELIVSASEKIVSSFTSTFEQVHVGMNKAAIAEILRQEETHRGMVFDYALVACGTDSNRAPSTRRIWQEGEVLSLDSGGTYGGYIGDMARMAVAGEPTPLQSSILHEVELVQQSARTAINPGSAGKEIFNVAHAALNESKYRSDLKFVAHAMGLISHEAPRLTNTGPIPYAADHAHRPLRPGMVLSIETWSEHPVGGFIKLEDTLIVTNDGWSAPGDISREFTINGDVRAGGQ